MWKLELLQAGASWLFKILADCSVAVWPWTCVLNSLSSSLFHLKMEIVIGPHFREYLWEFSETQPAKHFVQCLPLLALREFSLMSSSERTLFQKRPLSKSAGISGLPAQCLTRILGFVCWTCRRIRCRRISFCHKQMFVAFSLCIRLKALLNSSHQWENRW